MPQNLEPECSHTGRDQTQNSGGQAGIQIVNSRGRFDPAEKCTTAMAEKKAKTSGAIISGPMRQPTQTMAPSPMGKALPKPLATA